MDCKSCLKLFKTKEKYELHLQKCEPLKLQTQYKCKFCQQEYSSMDALTKHGKKTTSYCYKLIKSNTEILPMIKNGNGFLPMIQNVFQNPVFNNNNNKIVNKIKFSKHGKENIDHITQGVVLELFKNPKFTLICGELMKLVYFNPAVPGNVTWNIAYPKNSNAGVVYVPEDDQFERTSTREIIDDKFCNMIDLLVPLVRSIHQNTELYESLSDMQQVNIVRFFHHFKMFQISIESPEIYEALHKLCYEQRYIPMTIWRENGYTGNHLSLKF